jgi:site-specific recombinase XerC
MPRHLRHTAATHPAPTRISIGVRVPRRVGGEHSVAPVFRRARRLMSTESRLLPFQPTTMTAAQLAAVSFLARYAGHTHELYAYQLRRWFEWCEGNGLDPLIGVQRAHVELYIRSLGEAGLMASSTNTMMHGVRGYFRFAHIDGMIPADPAVYARLPKVHSDESRTQGLDRLELIRFLQVAQTITVHHGALAYLLGINALRAQRSLRSASRTTQRRCAATACSTWWARATSPRPCR